MAVVVALSGGIDSAVVLAQIIENKEHQISALFFDYGGKHNAREAKSAGQIAGYYKLELIYVDLRGIGKWLSSALLTSGTSTPHGYNQESAGMTEVPCRNMIMASIMAGIAKSHKAGEIYLGIQGSQNTFYPDCSINFVNAMRQAVAFGTDSKVQLYCPLLTLTKAGVLFEALRLNVPLRFTYSCYAGKERPCGECGACIKRKLAFQEIGVEDPAYG